MMLFSADAADDSLTQRANALAREVTIVDAHTDVPDRVWRTRADIGRRSAEGDFDYERAREGGLDVLFMVIYTPSGRATDGAKLLADSLIDMVEGFPVSAPDKFTLVSRVEEARRREGDRIAIVLGMENGSPLEGDLANLAHFYERGVRYVTLCHRKGNDICDSSMDDRRRWGGLSPFGRRLVTEMNRVGVMIDVSHASDEAFYQILELSQAPVIASHSSCRHFTPGFERNMDDAMIKALAEKGGVVHVNFGSFFIDDEVRRRFFVGYDKAERWAKEKEIDVDDPIVTMWRDRYFADHPHGFADVASVADHIEHVIAVAGIDHVGLGSDFDGVGDTLPEGLKDVSQYPNLIRELLARGYSREDIEKICSANTFRVWAEVERIARESRSDR